MNKEIGVKPFFSIIIPCYNMGSLVVRAIESVLNQSFENFEIIVINDGSTDNTLEVLNKYAQQDSRIKIFSKQNGGYCSAINKGLDNVSGSYFLMLGADDYLCQDLLLNVYNEANKTLPDLIGFQTLVIKSDGLVELDRHTCYNKMASGTNTSINEFSEQNHECSNIFFTRDTSKIYKTDILGNLRYFGVYGLDGDGVFAMLFAHRCTSFLCLPIPGYCFCIRSNSVSHSSKTIMKNIDRLNVWQQFYQVMWDKNYPLTREEIWYIEYYKNIINSLRSCCDNDVTNEVYKHDCFVSKFSQHMNKNAGLNN